MFWWYVNVELWNLKFQGTERPFNGRTTDSDSVNRGSTPFPPAIKKRWVRLSDAGPIFVTTVVAILLLMDIHPPNLGRKSGRLGTLLILGSVPIYNPPNHLLI
jgi:hypothetical protein